MARNQQQSAPAAAPAQEQPEQSEFNKLIEAKPVSWIPLGEQETLTITPGMVLNYLCHPTKKGKYPVIQDVMQFIMLCKQRGLNPWAGDAFLIGYDEEDGNAKFSIITAAQALFKRAEINAQFDGIESGVIVLKGETVEERSGDFILQTETLLGGWARVYRKDRKIQFTQKLNLTVYHKGNRQWRKDPGGMIVKCAEAAALRQAFPSDVGGLYLREELREDGSEIPKATPKALPAPEQVKLSDLMSDTPPPRPPVEENSEHFGEGPSDEDHVIDIPPPPPAPKKTKQPIPAPAPLPKTHATPAAPPAAEETDWQGGWKMAIASAATSSALDKIVQQSSALSEAKKGWIADQVQARRQALKAAPQAKAPATSPPAAVAPQAPPAAHQGGFLPPDDLPDEPPPPGDPEFDAEFPE